MKITGKIIIINAPSSGQTNQGNTWTKQEFVIETLENYPKKIAITIMNIVVDDLSYYKVGDTITCHINIESREHNNRWYTQVRAWKLEGNATNRN